MKPIRLSTHLCLAAQVALGGSGCVAPAEPPSEPLPVPFVVSDYYSPDGYFGDGEVQGFVDLQKSCPERAPGTQGDCYSLTYRVGVKRYAGIFWQHPHNNWGFAPGHQVSPGATRITFFARGHSGGEVLSVGAGQMDTLPRHDSFKLEQKTIGLTTSWTPQEVSFNGANYASAGNDGVLGAFLITLAAPADDATTVLYLDDIKWAK
jgi:hypothetical protein